MNEDVYARLARALDLLPGGFPPTTSGVEQQILKKIFTPEQAAIANNLTGTSETADIIANRANRPAKEIEEKLKAMRSRDIIWGSVREGVWKFRLAPFIVGIYESQWETMSHELSHLCEQYWNEGGAAGIMRYQPALHRVVPAQQALKRESILPYDDVKQLIAQATSFELRDCICRKQQELLGSRKCDFPVRDCLTFSAREQPRREHSITREEALKTLDQAEEIGLVHTVSNIASGVSYVCNCCGCCCSILRGITQFGIEQSVAKANYYAVIDLEQCNGCGICVDRCQVEACLLEEDAAVIDLSKCIGCGLCVTGCPTEAAKLNRRPDAEIITPPENYKTWEKERLRSRGLME
jgi:electron transport complex protein RnfB